jgi:very-short-patch-repair endonuclease
MICPSSRGAASSSASSKTICDPVAPMVDDFSNFRSAIAWPDLGEPKEVPTGDFIPLRVAVAKAVDYAAESFTMSGVTESPIETIFGAKLALVLRPVCEQLGWNFSIGARSDADVWLQPQYPLLQYRYDFAILAKGQPRPLILIECDGKEFHSTDEQQANDRRKDEAALKARVQLVRFSGSEINSDIDRCIRRTLRSMAA